MNGAELCGLKRLHEQGQAWTSLVAVLVSAAVEVPINPGFPVSLDLWLA